MAIAKSQALVWCLLAVVLATSANAKGVDPDLERLSRMGSAYEILAEHVYASAGPYQPKGDQESSSNLVAKYIEFRGPKAAELTDLEIAYSSLGARDDWKFLCGAFNLENLHILTSAMLEHGNLGPARITEPIRGLNRLIIKETIRARDMCVPLLGSKWPVQGSGHWSPRSKSPETAQQLAKLEGLRSAFELKTLARNEGPYAHDSKALGDKLAHVLSDATGQDTEAIVEQLRRNIYFPCRDLRSSPEAQDLIKPYYDLMASSLIVDPATLLMQNFYEDEKEKPQVYALVENGDLKENALRIKTCLILGELHVDNLAKLVAEGRQ